MQTSFYSINLKQLQAVDETVSKLITSRVMIVLPTTSSCTLSRYENDQISSDRVIAIAVNWKWFWNDRFNYVTFYVVRHTGD